MRDYSRVSGRLWTGRTGRALRKDRDAQVVAFYLLTAPTSNMIGLYSLTLPALCHETGIGEEAVRRCLDLLAGLDFAHYDEESETVWVVNMCRWQIGELELSKGDKRVKGIQKDVEGVASSPLLTGFLERYAKGYHLPFARGVVTPSGTPSEGLQKPSQAKPSKAKQSDVGADAPDDDPVDVRPVVREVAKVITGHHWFKQTLDPLQTAQNLVETFPNLDVLKYVKQAAIGLTPQEVASKGGGYPDKYLVRYLQNEDRDRVKAEREQSRANSAYANIPELPPQTFGGGR